MTFNPRGLTVDQIRQWLRTEADVGGGPITALMKEGLLNVYDFKTRKPMRKIIEKPSIESMFVSEKTDIERQLEDSLAQLGLFKEERNEMADNQDVFSYTPEEYLQDIIKKLGGLSTQLNNIESKIASMGSAKAAAPKPAFKPKSATRKSSGPPKLDDITTITADVEKVWVNENNVAVVTSDGLRISTFDEKLFEAAQEAEGMPAEITYGTNAKGYATLISIEAKI